MGLWEVRIGPTWSLSPGPFSTKNGENYALNGSLAQTPPEGPGTPKEFHALSLELLCLGECRVTRAGAHHGLGAQGAVKILLFTPCPALSSSCTSIFGAISGL